jgi:hypothetical protein
VTTAVRSGEREEMRKEERREERRGEKREEEREENRRGEKGQHLCVCSRTVLSSAALLAPLSFSLTFELVWYALLSGLIERDECVVVIHKVEHIVEIVLRRDRRGHLVGAEEKRREKRDIRDVFHSFYLLSVLSVCVSLSLSTLISISSLSLPLSLSLSLSLTQQDKGSYCID